MKWEILAFVNNGAHKPHKESIGIANSISILSQFRESVSDEKRTCTPTRQVETNFNKADGMLRQSFREYHITESMIDFS